MPKTTRGVTPHGGDLATTIFYDGDGAETDDPAKAARAEVHEYTAGGTPVARTVLTPRPAGPLPDNPVGGEMAEPDVADTAKDTWDVWVNEDGQYRSAETLRDFAVATGLVGDPDNPDPALVANFMTLPAYTAAPAQLKRDATACILGRGKVAG